MMQRLQAFVTVVEKESYTRAAEVLFTTQSALSQQIRTLESNLGAELFDHSVRRVVLTGAGKAFYPRARQLLAAYSDAVFETRLAARNSAIQQLKVGCIDDQISQYWVDIFHLQAVDLERFHPTASRCDNRAALYQAVSHGDIDICLSLENAQIAEHGLSFLPLVACP